MNASRESDGFLMLGSWAPDAQLARTFDLDGGRLAPGNARALLVALLEKRIAEDDLCDVVVLTSELVTNAVRHGGAGPGERIVVYVAIAGALLRIEVCDDGPGFEPPQILRQHIGGGGSGLVLVDRLSSSWGVSNDDRTCVWFERPLQPR